MDTAGKATAIDHEILREPDVVHNATGMVSVQQGITCEAALTQLRLLAASTDSCLVTVAQKVVSRNLRLGPAATAEPGLGSPSNH